MEELKAWADDAADRRGFTVERSPGALSRYVVTVRERDVEGHGEGMSVTFAAVRAFDDLSAKMNAE